MLHSMGIDGNRVKSVARRFDVELTCINANRDGRRSNAGSHIERRVESGP
jgi:hypothetical protein